VLTDVDPRGVRATQPSVTRPGVSYYLTTRYQRTGHTFADYHRVANRFPVVYQREDGEQLIISGHHRAAVALLNGKQLAARLVAGPWGPPRTENTRPLAPPRGRSPTPATAYLTPLLTAGVPPTWEHEVISDHDGDIVKEILNGQRCHLKYFWGEERTTRHVQSILVDLGLSPVHAAEQGRFASTGSLRGRLNDELPRITTADALGGSQVRELSVHLRCGTIRGPLPITFEGDIETVHRWQSCRCQESPEKWPLCDVSRLYELCILCQRGVAGGVTRWSWEACRLCLDINRGIGKVLGRNPLPLGRHSIMNGVAIPTGGDREEVARGRETFMAMAGEWERLSVWQHAEIRRLADSRGWDHTKDIPLRVWQDTFVASTEESRDAFRRYTGVDPTTFSVN